MAPHDLPAALDAMLLAGEALAQTGRPRPVPGDRPAHPRPPPRRRGTGGDTAVHHVAGLAGLIAGDEVTGFAELRQAAQLADRIDDPSVLIRVARAAILTGDDNRAGVLAARAEALARISGSTALVPQALETVAMADLATGHYEAAAGAATTGADLARASRPARPGRRPPGHPGGPRRAGGGPETCVLRIRAAARWTATRAPASPGPCANGRSPCWIWSKAVRWPPSSGCSPGRRTPSSGWPPRRIWWRRRTGPAGLPVDEVGAAFDRWAGHTGQPTWLALRARCRALRAPDGETADENFREALRRHRHGAGDFATAHTQSARTAGSCAVAVAPPRPGSTCGSPARPSACSTRNRGRVRRIANFGPRASASPRTR